MLSVVGVGRTLTSFVILNRKKLLQGNLDGGIIFKFEEKGQMTAELMVKWLREVQDRRPGAVLKKM
jgi:hypothetical protein